MVATLAQAVEDVTARVDEQAAVNRKAFADRRLLVDTVADGIRILAWLFWNLSPLGDCLAACDVNGDQTIDSSDAIYAINYQLLDGPPPPLPFPDCGVDPGLECELYLGCL